MLRTLLLGLSALHVVAPRAIVDRAERIAFANPTTGRLRPWTLATARLEGLLFCWLLLRRPGGDRSAGGALRSATALLGAAMALAPRSALEFGLRIAYENPENLEVRSWVGPATRLIGAVYLAVALFSGRAGSATADEFERE
ncbi:hypothetical protein ACFQGT_13125 [Natrialbaceae archaeon GCM10025810]|uniref:hypothetical protein n=1 Tax=Halovalidus salilacus TaxID=3075124 RepID=UPI00361CCF8C